MIDFDNVNIIFSAADDVIMTSHLARNPKVGASLQQARCQVPEVPAGRGGGAYRRVVLCVLFVQKLRIRTTSGLSTPRKRQNSFAKGEIASA